MGETITLRHLRLDLVAHSYSKRREQREKLPKDEHNWRRPDTDVLVTKDTKDSI